MILCTVRMLSHAHALYIHAICICILDLESHKQQLWNAFIYGICNLQIHVVIQGNRIYNNHYIRTMVANCVFTFKCAHVVNWSCQCYESSKCSNYGVSSINDWLINWSLSKVCSLWAGANCLNSEETTQLRRKATWEKDWQSSPKPVTYTLTRSFSHASYGIGHALSSHITAFMPVTGVPNPRLLFPCRLSPELCCFLRVWSLSIHYQNLIYQYLLSITSHCVEVSHIQSAV